MFQCSMAKPIATTAKTIPQAARSPRAPQSTVSSRDAFLIDDFVWTRRVLRPPIADELGALVGRAEAALVVARGRAPARNRRRGVKNRFTPRASLSSRKYALFVDQQLRRAVVSPSSLAGAPTAGQGIGSAQNTTPATGPLGHPWPPRHLTPAWRTLGHPWPPGHFGLLRDELPPASGPACGQVAGSWKRTLFPKVGGILDYPQVPGVRIVSSSGCKFGYEDEARSRGCGCNARSQQRRPTMYLGIRKKQLRRLAPARHSANRPPAWSKCRCESTTRVDVCMAEAGRWPANPATRVPARRRRSVRAVSARRRHRCRFRTRRSCHPGPRPATRGKPAGMRLSVVGRDPFGPHGSRDVAEHGPAIQTLGIAQYRPEFHCATTSCITLSLRERVG